MANSAFKPFSLDEPYFIVAMVAAVLGDVILLGSSMVGLGLLPLGGLGIIPILFGIGLRQLIGICIFGYVLTALKSPLKLIPDDPKIKEVAESVEAWIGLLFQPWIAMLFGLIFWFLPLPMLTASLFAAVLLHNRVVNFLVQQVAILALAAATGGAGLVAEAGAVAEVGAATAEGAAVAGELAEGAATASRGVTVASEASRASGVTREAEALGQGGKAAESAEALEQDYFGMPEWNPIDEAKNDLFSGSGEEDEFAEERRKLIEEAREEEARKERDRQETLRLEEEAARMAAEQASKEASQDIIERRQEAAAAEKDESVQRRMDTAISRMEDIAKIADIQNNEGVVRPMRDVVRPGEQTDDEDDLEKAA